MQSKDELEQHYATPDPWGYQTNKDDAIRKQKILSHVTSMYHRVLDIGAGEGFILSGILAPVRHAYEMSDNATKRLPGGIFRVTEPYGKYDLILACGVLYKQYDYEKFHELISKHASKHVITCNISDWEVNNLPAHKIIAEERFPYREYTEHLVKYDFTA